MSSLYNELVMDHFRNPRNIGEMENPDGTGHAESSADSDIMELYIKVTDDRISEAKFRTFGCAAAIAASSMTTVMVKEKTIEEALKITNLAVTEALGGLPPIKIHCSVLAEQAIQSAIEDYYKNRGEVL
ncbi:iron-sulfur cluster assembly scaffold protein [Chloroflexota bacterium]